MNTDTHRSEKTEIKDTCAAAALGVVAAGEQFLFCPPAASKSGGIYMTLAG
jgi:hypothetical protein